MMLRWQGLCSSAGTEVSGEERAGGGGQCSLAPAQQGGLHRYAYLRLRTMSVMLQRALCVHRAQWLVARMTQRTLTAQTVQMVHRHAAAMTPLRDWEYQVLSGMCRRRTRLRTARHVSTHRTRRQTAGTLRDSILAEERESETLWPGRAVVCPGRNGKIMKDPECCCLL